MSSRNKWNARYRESNAAATDAAEILVNYQHLLPTSGQALDLACGRAANAFFLSAHGLDTTAWDISDVAIEQVQQRASQAGLSIKSEQRDVTDEPPTQTSFDVIVVSRFLDREILPAIKNAVRPEGLVYYQTFIKDKVAQVGPDKTDYLLEQNELLHFFQDWIVRAYHDEGSIGNCREGLRNQAAIVAQRPA